MSKHNDFLKNGDYLTNNFSDGDGGLLENLNELHSVNGENIQTQSLLEGINELQKSVDFTQFNYALLGAINVLGADFFFLGGWFDVKDEMKEYRSLSNYDDLWRVRYEQEYMQIDPVVHHAFNSTTPLIWSDALFKTEEQRNLRKECLLYNLGHGITFPVHKRNGSLVLLNLIIDKPISDKTDLACDILIGGTVLSTYCFEVFNHLIKKECDVKNIILKRREREVILLVSQGKSTKEIAKIIYLSEHGVNYHLRNIFSKLEVSCRYKAVNKAIMLGII